MARIVAQSAGSGNRRSGRRNLERALTSNSSPKGRGESKREENEYNLVGKEVFGL
jgi:hypothetical protein